MIDKYTDSFIFKFYKCLFSQREVDINFIFMHLIEYVKQNQPFFGEQIHYPKYQPKRSMFDKTSLNPDWVPRIQPYSKHRKPRQPEWSDPNAFYPLLIPAMHRPMKPKDYLKKMIEYQELIKSWRKKQFLMEDIRSGDIIDITYQQTFQSEKTVVHRCLLLGLRRRNSLTAMMQVAIRFGGMSLKANFPIHCPKVKNIKLVTKGSGNLRANLKTNWKKMGKANLLNPKIKRGVMKLRGGALKKKRTRQISAFKFNRVQSDIVKKVR